MIVVVIATLAILSGVVTFSALWALMPPALTARVADAQSTYAAIAAIAVTLIVAIALGWWA